MNMNRPPKWIQLSYFVLWRVCVRDDIVCVQYLSIVQVYKVLPMYILCAVLKYCVYVYIYDMSSI